MIDRLVHLFILIKHFEGCRLTPYICPAGVWTCGWGSTGHDVFPGKPWTQDYADRRMEQDALRFAVGVLAACPSLASSDRRLSALADFAYNCGLPAFKGSTLLRRALVGDWERVKVELARWVRGGGRVLPGLVARRAAEIALI